MPAMKNISNRENKKEIIERIKKVNPSSRALWGKMNAHQAICHLSDQLRDLHGTRPVKYQGNIFLRLVLRPILSNLQNWPKAVFPAAKEYSQQLNGTKPGEFERDKNELLQLMEKLDLADVSKPIPLHPAFGKLSHQQYARIVYQHFDHHLKQFGA